MNSSTKNLKIYKKTKSISHTNLSNKDIDSLFNKIETDLKDFKSDQATRKSSEAILNYFKKDHPILGGSADLTGSNNTKGKEMSVMDSMNTSGQYIHYGVREHGMAAIMNGIAATKIYKTYSGTFLSFADYMKPSLRLAALMKINPIQVFTHDSIGLGEDGPTHQPIEQINMLRLIPNSYVFRPCDLKETIVCWREALKINDAPSFICLSRQNLPQISNKKLDSKKFKGAYVIYGPKINNDITIIATGSEVSLAVNVAVRIRGDGIIAKVISMPSTSIFEKQSKTFKNNLLKSKSSETFVIEAGSTMYWNKYTKYENIFGLDNFGASAPGNEVFRKFGLTTETVSSKIKRKIRTK